MSSLELSKNEMNSIKPHFTSLILFLSLLVQLYQTLETDQAVIDGKYNVLAQNLTAEELEFLHKVVNYDTEVNLRYLILNKTQEMYAQNYAQMYKQAEDQIVFHEDHLKDYRKYKYYFDIYHEFKRIYYTFHTDYFDRVFRHARRAMAATFRSSKGQSVDGVDAFLANESLMDARLGKIFESVDEVLTGHYCHVDDMAGRKFFSNFRYMYDERAYKNLRYEFDYHLGHEFFRSAAAN